MMNRTYTDRHFEMAAPATTSATASGDDSDDAQATSTDDATAASGDAFGTSAQACSQKKNEDSDLTSIGRYTPERRVTNRVLKGLQEGTKILIGTVRPERSRVA